MNDAQRPIRFLQAGALLFCAFALVSRFWAAEDAYITFRSVENLFAGFGLVYNPGELIESYTHPLWMSLLVLMRGLGLPLHAGSVLLGFGLALTALAFLIFRGDDRGRPVLPLAALALCAISGFRDFAVSGMEFPLVLLLLTLFFTGLEKWDLRDRPGYFASLLALLYLTRPEMALLSPWYSVFFVLELLRGPEGVRLYASGDSSGVLARVLGLFRGDKFRAMLAWALPFILFVGLWHLFRWQYYGDIFPNTYYAKSGGAPYYSQGLKYLAATLAFAPALWVLIAAAILPPLLEKTRAFMPPKSGFAYLRDLGIALLMILYVVRVGGDFMMYRFLLPEIVIIALVAQRFLQSPRAEVFARPRIYGAALALFVALSFIPGPLTTGFIADERKFFTKDEKGGPMGLLLGQDFKWGRAGVPFQKLQACLEYDEFRISNSQDTAKCLRGVGLGYFGAAAGPGVRIQDEQGLPDREIARAPVLTRFRPGHEHYAELRRVIQGGALFCSTGEPAYDRVMATRAGIVIHLRPDLLATMPNIRERLRELVKLKRGGSRVIGRLEARYGVTVEELARRAAAWEKDSFMREKNRCWREYQGDSRGYFY